MKSFRFYVVAISQGWAVISKEYMVERKYNDRKDAISDSFNLLIYGNIADKSAIYIGCK